jgi:hypothetical protein
VFLGLAPQGQYACSCLLYLHLLNHWKEHNLSIFSYLQSSIYSFNEEVGEMTFAQLARTILGDTDQSSMDKLREAYQAQPFVAAVSPECATDTHSATSDFPNEQQVIREHLQITLEQLRNGLWRPYNLPSGTADDCSPAHFSCLTDALSGSSRVKSFKQSSVLVNPADIPLNPTLTPSLHPESFTPALEQVNKFLEQRLLHS